MKNIKSLYFLILIGLFIAISSCGKKTSSFENIVKTTDNIAAVGQLNIKQIMDKGEFWEEFGWVKFFAGKFIDSAEWGMNIFSQKKFLVTADENNNPDYFVLQFDLQSSEKFESKLNELIHPEITQEGAFKIASVKKVGQISLAWNNEYGFAVLGLRGKDDEGKMAEILKNIAKPIEKTLDKNVTDAINSVDDMSFIAYTGKMNWGKMKKAESEEVKELLKNSYVIAGLNGSDGEVKLSAKTYGVDKFLASKYNVTGEQGVKQEMIEEILMNNLVGLFSMSLNKEKVKDLLVNNIDNNAKLSAKYADAFDGEFVVGLKDLDFNSEIPNFKTIIGINDTKLLDELLDSIPNLVRVDANNWQVISKKRVTVDRYANKEMAFEEEIEKPSLFLRLKDKKLYIQTDHNFIFKPKTDANSNKNIDETLAKSKPFYLYFNAEAISNESKLPMEVLGVLQTIQYASGSSDIRDNVIEIKFKDKTQNGWKQLFKSLSSQVQNLM